MKSKSAPCRVASLFVTMLLCAGLAASQDSALPDLRAPAIVATAIADSYQPAYSYSVGPRTYLEGINSLTGLPYPSDAARSRRNLIIKVSNWPQRVRPQHGINAADIVYEYEAEGGITRFAAIYRSQAPQQIGSIRSARLLDIELIRMYAALLAYSGTSEPIHQIYMNADFRSRLLSPSLGHDCQRAGFCRDDAYAHRGYAHTLFADARQLWDLASRLTVNQGYRALGFNFALQADDGGDTAHDTYANWYNRTDTRWQYDQASGIYLRYADGAPHIDAADSRQLWADNLIYLQVLHIPRPDLFPAGSRDESEELVLRGQGQALVLREGKLYSGFWRRSGVRTGDALGLAHADGEPIALKPGRSWITIMRNLDQLEISETRQALDTIASADS
ncbi:MAG: DUF3048 domain-containing protein [Chloroflexi bacterium]|nr:DUF3048 domain-containing protein [Chloroflexota bacterium]MCY4248556.1 DUF3048 domain-containing protein [Chloroflexota bacterium]